MRARYSSFFVAVAIFAILGTASLAADALTPADYKYIKSLGWNQDNYVIGKLTEPQRSMLHRLINSGHISGPKRQDNVNDYLVAVALGGTFDKLCSDPETRKAACDAK